MNDDEQHMWILDYERKLWAIFYQIDFDYHTFTEAKDFDPLDPQKDNFTIAGVFSSNFVDALEEGIFDNLFRSYHEKRLNAVVQFITMRFINSNIFHGSDTIHFYSSDKQLLFVMLLESLILKQMKKWE